MCIANVAWRDGKTRGEVSATNQIRSHFGRERRGLFFSNTTHTHSLTICITGDGGLGYPFGRKVRFFNSNFFFL